MIRRPPDGNAYLTELVAQINSELGRKEPLIIGVAYVGTNLVLRFRAPYGVGWVVAHVQSSVTGGMTYDPAVFVSSTEVDCRADRLQTRTIALTSGVSYAVFLVPVQKDGAGTVVRFDGQGGRPDNMATWTSTTRTGDLNAGALTVTTLTTSAGALTYGANDSGGAGKRLVLAPNA